MSMYYANNEDSKLIHISQAKRGLNCNCTCLAFGETLVAKKGEIIEHHFSHYSSKESCNIQPESLLHLYGKEVIQNKKYIILPANKLFNSQTENIYLELKNIVIEQSIDNIRPDITANIANHDQQQLHIELLVTHSISDNKADIIKELKLNTIEIDLTPLLTKNIIFPSKEAENFILNETSNKKWIYPKIPTKDHTAHLQEIPLNQSALATSEPLIRREQIISKQGSKTTTKQGLFSKSELLIYAIQILQDNLYLHVPLNSAWNDFILPIIFSNIDVEKLLFKPHLIGLLPNSISMKCKTIHIYLSENGRENPEITRWVHSLNLNTIMIDLSEIIRKHIAFPSPQAEQIILKTIHNKKWLRFESC